MSFLFTGGYTVQKVFKYDSEDLAKLAESGNYSGIILCIANDETWVYAAGTATSKVFQYDPSDLSKNAESAAYGSTIYSILTYNGKVYTCGATTCKVWELDPSDMSKDQESAVYDGTPWVLKTDGTYLYMAGSDSQKVYKLQFSDLSKLSETSTAYGGTIYCMCYLDGYIYCGGGTTQKVWKIDPSDMSKVAESADYGGIIYSLTTDGTYIYCSGSTTNKVWKIDPSDMSKIDESAAAGHYIMSLVYDGKYIYGCTYSGDQKVYTWNTDLTQLQVSSAYGGGLNALDILITTPVHRFLVPAYFYPSWLGSDWDNLIPELGADDIIICNVNSGPGTSVNSDWVTYAMTPATNAGISLAGYVYTNWGARTYADVITDIDYWESLYGIVNIFIDQVSTDSADLSYYEDLYDYIHANSGLVILNHGSTPDEGYMAVSDIDVIFENDYDTLSTHTFPAWAEEYSRFRKGGICHDVANITEMKAATRKFSDNRVGYNYITDDVMPNPWDVLTTYIEEESDHFKNPTYNYILTAQQVGSYIQLDWAL